MINKASKDQVNNYLPGFQFNQGSLQDFVDCPRLFQLRYIEQISWPFREQELSQQYREYIRLGTIFHQMVYQYYLGIPTNQLARISSSNQKLAKWWDDFITYHPTFDNYQLFPEISLSIPLGPDRLVAKFDLLAIKRSEHSSVITGKQEMIIIDWKTSRKRPNQSWLVNRLQSRIYPLLLVEASTQFMDGNKIEPDNVTMIYWYVNFPTEALRIYYNHEMFLKDKALILELVESIKGIGDGEALKTENLKRCKYCEYRSLCNRGSIDDSYEDEIDTDQELSLEFLENFDYSQIAEIEF